MLVLSRKLNESIVINYDIVVTVLGVQGDRVRLGIEAPGEIPVHCQELYEKMQNQEVLLSIGDLRHWKRFQRYYISPCRHRPSTIGKEIMPKKPPPPRAWRP